MIGLRSAMTSKLGHPVSRGNASGGDEALQRAMLALNSGQPADAERIAADVLKTSRRNVPALQVLANALLMQNRIADAIVPLETAARGNHDPQIETMLGIVLRQAGRIEDALSWLKRAVKRRPPHAPAFYEFGCLLSFLNRDKEAVEAFNRGLDVAPLVPQLSVQLGYVLLRRKRYAEAKAAFSRALANSAGSPEALFGLAKVHQAAGDNAAAAGYFRQCLVSRPNDADMWLQLGYCLLELGDRAAGYECFRTATRGDPQNYGNALSALVKSGRGRFWLKPSGAAQYFRETKS
jgi:tetratricopeptide (TPR) repeat protein